MSIRKNNYTSLFIFPLIFFLVLLNGNPAIAQPNKQKTRILLIFDCSGSMWAKWGKETRMDVAKRVLTHMVDSMKNIPNLELALRCYGHQSPVPKHDCRDTKLEVPFKANNAAEIVDFVKKVQPNGWTPIAYSLSQASTDFPDTKTKNVILLITDGIEECDGDPCTVSQQLQSKNIIVQPYVIGIGLDDSKMKAFDCVGKHYNPKSEKELGNLLSDVVSEALDKTPTTLQVHLLDTKGQPTESDVELTFTNAPTGKVVYNYVHTLNELGRPDTFAADPAITYNLRVHTTPPIFRKNITVQKAKHNIIKIDAPQGELKISCSANDYRNVQAVVRQNGSTETVYVQEMNSTHKFLTGAYDLEILTMPRLRFNKIQITQGDLRQIQIPEPGKLEMNYPNNVIGSIYIQREKQLELVEDFTGSSIRRKDIYLLQPGKYILIYRQSKSTNNEDTRELSFTISSNGYTSVSLD